MMYPDKCLEKSGLTTAPSPHLAGSVNELNHFHHHVLPHTVQLVPNDSNHHHQHQHLHHSHSHQHHLQIHPSHQLQTHHLLQSPPLLPAQQHQLQHQHQQQQHLQQQLLQQQQQQQQVQHSALQHSHSHHQQIAGQQSQHANNSQQQQQQPLPQSQQQQSQHQQQQQQQQQQQHSSAMFTRFDANKSTKGASKLRRDLINAEIANLRDLLPLPQSTRQRLSQLQLMALVCVYVRKANYFQQVFKRHDISMHQAPTPNIGFSKALSGFLMMLTQNGKLLYISDNAAEYLGHSMEDLLIHGDSVYDIIDKQDHSAIQAELNRNVPPQPGQHINSAAAAAAAISNLEGEHRMFLCRMNVSRNARRQMRFGDQKVVLVQGHYLSFLPLCSRNEPVFLATCTPIAMPETRECVVQGATNVFTTIHSMDMKIAHIDKNGEFHLGYSRTEIQGVSWYGLIHSDNLREAQSKHRLITQSEQDRSCILLVRMQRRQGDFIWVHVVLQVRDAQDTNQQPVIVCTNQVLNEREASVMILNSWLYHYYTVQSKIQFGLPYDGGTRVPATATSPGNPAAVYYHHHIHHHNAGSAFAPASGANTAYSTLHHPSNHHHHHPHHQYHPHHHNHHIPAAYGSYHSPNNSTAAAARSNGESLLHAAAADHRACDGISLGEHHHHHTKLGLEPVDYSQLGEEGADMQAQSNHMPTSPLRSPLSHKSNGAAELRCASTNSSISSQTSADYANIQHCVNHHSRSVASPPPAKRRAVGKLEPIYLAENSPEAANHEIAEIEPVYQLHNQRASVCGVAENNSSVLYATVVPTRSRLLNKLMPSDPADFMDQWNPSPPWSESAQKLSLDNSSSSQQELSPCVTTTPPTPTSAPPAGPNCVGAAGMQTLGSAFSFNFEWMPDQMVPVADTCVTCINSEGLSVVMSAHHHHHHHHHTHPPPPPPPWTSHVLSPEHYNHLLANGQNQRILNLNESSSSMHLDQHHLHLQAQRRDQVLPKTELTEDGVQANDNEIHHKINENHH